MVCTHVGPLVAVEGGDGAVAAQAKSARLSCSHPGPEVAPLAEGSSPASPDERIGAPAFGTLFRHPAQSTNSGPKSLLGMS
jgi:hypothetical protein